MSARPRRGFNLLELVVVLIIIAILIALVLPAINSSRTPSRRTQCLNNMRNVGLAIQNHASQNGGKLVMLHGEDGDPATMSDRYSSWPRQLLRVLDNSPVDREIAVAETSGPGTDAGMFTPPYLPIFVCPQDEDSVQQPGGLSYVVSGGYGFFPVDRETGTVTERGTHSLAQDWDGDGEVSDEDRLITRATGVVWRPDPAVPPLTLDDIQAGDGTGTTLLLTESLHAGPWITHDTRSLAFVIGRERLSFDPGTGPLAVTKADLGPFAINGAKEAEGPVPAPSSHHGGSVMVIWADGHGSGIAETIDPLVYVRLLTSQGSLYGQEAIDERALGF